MKLVSFNVNGLRSRLHQLAALVEKHRPDIIGLQETKVQDADFPVAPIRDAGYHVTFRGMKSYNGVATITRTEPESVLHGFHEGPDNEDVRVLMTVVNGIPIVNTYAPQGYKIDSEKYAFKLEWYRQLRAYFEQRLDPSQPAIWTGDLNVAPEPIDVYHPDRRVNDPDFHIAARNAFKAVAAWGFTDVFRKLYPDRVQYTYWDYFRGAFEHNWGWRIDHIMATAPLAERCTVADVDMDFRACKDASDHTVLWALFD